MGSLAILALLILRLPTPQDGFWSSLLTKGVEVAIPLAFFALLGQALLRLWRATLGAPSVWGTIHDMLEHLRDEVLGDQLGSAPEHAHRATLFQRRRAVWWAPKTWFKHGWLVPVERSGYTTRKTTCMWRAGDDASETEGVAGASWVNNGVIVLTHEKLSDPTSDGLTPDKIQECIENYAAQTFVSTEWVEARLDRAEEGGPGLARFYCGIPVRVRGKPWGVIVIDSTASELKHVEDINKTYKLAGKALGSLLTHDGILKRG